MPSCARCCCRKGNCWIEAEADFACRGLFTNWIGDVAVFDRALGKLAKLCDAALVAKASR